MGLKIPKPIINEQTVFKPKETLGNVWPAGFGLGQNDGTMRAIQREDIIEEAREEGPLLDAKVINEEFERVKADGPMTRKEAQLVQDAKDEREKRMQILANAPDTFLGGLTKFVSVAGGAASDPFDFSAGAALSVATGGLAALVKAAKIFKGVSKTALIAARFGKATTDAQKAIQAVDISRKAKFTYSLLDNMTATAINESFVMGASEAERIEYTQQQMLTNVFGASVLMTSGFHGASALLGKALKAGPRHVEAIYNTFDTALSTGKNPDFAIESIGRHLDKTLELDEAFQTATKKAFGEERGLEYLKDSEDIIDVFGKIKQDFLDAKIAPDDMNTYFKMMETEEADVKRLKYLQDNPAIEMSKAEREEIRDNFMSKESDLDYDPDTERLLQQTEATIEQKKFDDLEAMDAEARFRELKAIEDEGTLTKSQLEELKQAETFDEIENERIQAFQDFIVCSTGVAL